MDATQQSRMQGVFERYPEVAAVYLFGSRANGTARRESDYGHQALPALGIFLCLFFLFRHARGVFCYGQDVTQPSGFGIGLADLPPRLYFRDPHHGGHRCRKSIWAYRPGRCFSGFPVVWFRLCDGFDFQGSPWPLPAGDLTQSIANPLAASNRRCTPSPIIWQWRPNIARNL